MGIKSGVFIDKVVLDEVIDDESINKYSVELSVDKIYRNKGRGVIGVNDTFRDDLTEVPSHSRYDFKQRGKQQAGSLLREYGVSPRNRDREFYWLDDGRTYTVEFAEDYTIPEGYVGFIYPKHNLSKMGATVYTNAQEEDDGFHTALLFVDGSIMIEDDASIARLVVCETD